MTAQLTAPAGTAFVERIRAAHVRRADGWCACGFPHCGIRVLLDHLDHAEARVAAADRGHHDPAPEPQERPHDNR